MVHIEHLFALPCATRLAGNRPDGLALALLLVLAGGGVLLFSPETIPGAAKRSGETGREPGVKPNLPAPAAKPPGKAPPAKRFEISLPQGSIEIATTPVTTIRVEAYRSKGQGRSRDPSLDKTIVLTTGEGVITARAQGNVAAETIFRFLAPAGLKLDLKTSRGNITVDDFPGDVRASVSNGHLRLGRIGGAVELNVTDGNVFLASALGPVRVKSSGGQVKAGALKGPSLLEASGGSILIRYSAGKLDAQTSGGSIKVFSAGDAVTAEATGGDVYVNFLDQPKGHSFLRSSSGALHIKAVPELNLVIEAEGRVRGNLPVAWEGERHSDALHKGKLNRGDKGILLRAKAPRIGLGALKDKTVLLAGREEWSDLEPETGKRGNGETGRRGDGDTRQGPPEPQARLERERAEAERARELERQLLEQKQREENEARAQAAREERRGDGETGRRGERPAVKLIPAGLLLREGGLVEGEVLAADETRVTYRIQGKEESMPSSRVSALLFQPVPETSRDFLESSRRGLLLANGDFLEGELVRLEPGRVTLASVIFGLKQFQVPQEATALVLRGPKPKAAPIPSSLKGYEPVGIKPPDERSK